VHTDLHHDLEKRRPDEGGVLAGQAAIGASGAVTFLAERYRRIARRRIAGLILRDLPAEQGRSGAVMNPQVLSPLSSCCAHGALP
jgi:hypothetical protein